MSRMRIATVVPAKHRLVFTGRSWEVLAKGHRYLVDNVREALSEPGQWYLDRPLAQLTYISKLGEQPGQAVVIAPQLEQPLVLQGDLTKKRWVQHIQFSVLSFAHTNWTLPPTGQLQPASPALERRVPALRCDEGGPARASLADHGLANCASGIPIRTYRFRRGQQRRRAPAGACDAGPAKFTIITDGNNLFATSGPRSRHARARRRTPNRITPLLH